MEVSYFKTQWLYFLVGLVDIGISIYRFCVGDELWGIVWAVAAMMWFIMSIINHIDEKIKLLEKKQERDDAMYDLVQELVLANKIDREIAKKYEARLKKLEDRR